MTAKEKAVARKAVRVVIVGIVSFSISWTPPLLCLYCDISGSEIFDRDRSFISGIFAKASLVYSPLICLLVCKRGVKEKECVNRLIQARIPPSHNRTECQRMTHDKNELLLSSFVKKYHP